MTATAYGKAFDPPRPGAWELDLTHFPRASTRFHSSLFAEHFPKGFAEGTRMYGLLLDRLEVAEVNGFVYNAPRAVGAPVDAKGPPPKAIFKLLTWFHPEIRRRIKTAKDAVTRKTWLEDLAHWDKQMKPQAIREHLEIQRVDPRSLDTAGLAEHFRAAWMNAENGVYRHGRFTMTACVPVGDYLAHAKEWTGEPVHALLRPVKGYSAVSNGVAAPELTKLAALLRKSPSADALLSGKPEDVLAALRSEPGVIGAATREWLDVVGYRIVTGYDVCDFYALELPGTLVGGLRSAVNATPGGESSDSAEGDVHALRDKVPSAHRAHFDELLADARAVYRLRDERDHYNDGWSTGLMRRAFLEIGRRAAEAGRVDAPELLVDATAEEALSMLDGDGAGLDEQLKARLEWRRMVDPAKLPQQLGFPPSAPPPAEWLPHHAARLARATDIFLFGLFQSSERESTRDVIRGIPVSPGVYEGPARLVVGSEDFEQVRKGDVLIARSTSPYFNVLLPMLGAIVTDRGGALSHAAIVAREYGIPGIVGTKTATTAIANGRRVRVDGSLGEVQVLGA